MYKGIDDVICVERAEMKKGKIKEYSAIDIRFSENMTKNNVKKEFQDLIRMERATEVKELLDRMLRFLAEMPVDKHHDYRTFRHTGLREYLINRFLREKLSK
jgi:hypothetical protein